MRVEANSGNGDASAIYDGNTGSAVARYGTFDTGKYADNFVAVVSDSYTSSSNLSVYECVNGMITPKFDRYSIFQVQISGGTIKVYNNSSYASVIYIFIYG